ETIGNSASSQRSALLVAKHHKWVVHFDNCHRIGVEFVPLAIKSLGGWSSTAISIFKAFGHYLGTRFGLLPSKPTLHHYQRLSVTQWQSNARMWLGSSSILSPEVDGQLGFKVDGCVT
uniref:Uncharacterized protein n=1 Tax=Amphimedon queenslandica TaxID=400682 RepID=A0A1X7V3D4_AMPQE